MASDPFKEGWQQGVRQAIIEAENVATDADNGGEWGDPGTELRDGLIKNLRELLTRSPSTPTYTHKLTKVSGDLLTREEWLGAVKVGGFVDYDGYGYAVKDGMFWPHAISPSTADVLPDDATHVVWFNR